MQMVISNEDTQKERYEQLTVQLRQSLAALHEEHMGCKTQIATLSVANKHMEMEVNSKKTQIVDHTERVAMLDG
jgi:predicted  nucleic acid-binding Zn-ribbon protein